METEVETKKIVGKNEIEKFFFNLQKKWRQPLQKVFDPTYLGNKLKIAVSNTHSIILAADKCPLVLVIVDNKYCENVEALYLGRWVDPEHPNNNPQHWLLAEGESFPYYFASEKELAADFFKEQGIKPVLKTLADETRKKFLEIISEVR